MIGALTDVAVAHMPGTSEVVDDVVNALQSEGLSVETEDAEVGPFAGLELLLPTAITVLLTEKYFGTILAEAAKDHYAAVKAAFRRLIADTTGPERKVRITSVGTPGKGASVDPTVLSMYAILKSGRRAKFLFEHDLAARERDKAIQSMHETMAAHYKYPHDALTTAIAAAGLDNAKVAVLRFDQVHGSWKPLQPTRSARSNER